jgi:hypothetical protein
MSQEPITSDELSMIIADRKAGMPYSAISRKHGVPAATIGRWCRAAGFPSISRRGRWSDNITDEQYREKFRSLCKIDERGCWVWQGWCHKPPRAYGQMYYRGEQWTIHRLSYLLHKGALPDGLVVCHACDNQRCGNPDHLWLGTQRDNLIDSIVKKRHRCARATQCPKGHPYDAKNTYVDKQDGARHCKECARARWRKAYGKKAA